MVGTFEVDILDALNINGRSDLGWRNDDPHALLHCQRRKEKIRLRKLIDHQHVLTNSRTSRIAGRFNIKGPFIFDLDRWYKEPYPGNGLDDDAKDTREKDEETS